MSIATQISRLTTLRNNIRTKLIALGIISNSSADLEDCYDGINSITAQAATTYTPTTSNQTIASGTYLTGAQTIEGDANLVSGNIINGTSIFGVSGSYVPYLEFTNISVTTWIHARTNPEYSDYPYFSLVTCTGVTSDMFPYVEFSENDAISGFYFELAKSYNGGVYIYAVDVPSTLTIPKITFYKRS